MNDELNGDAVDAAVAATQSQIVNRFFSRCEEVWHHGKLAGVPVTVRKRDIEKMITDDVVGRLTGPPMIDSMYILASTGAAEEICNRLDK